MEASTPILPARIDETVRSIARLHAEHHRGASSIQRAVDCLTAIVGQPKFIGALTVGVGFWCGANLAAPLFRMTPVDPPPFAWLSTAASLIALYVTVMILSTQRRENILAELREQLTLELAILSEQKTAKTIELLEEMRRDNPLLRNRVDEEAEAMSIPPIRHPCLRSSRKRTPKLKHFKRRPISRPNLGKMLKPILWLNRLFALFGEPLPRSAVHLRI